MRTPLAVVFIWLALAGSARADERAAPAPPGATFEAIAAGATRTGDVSTLLAPFFARCELEKREIDRTRCAVSQAYLRRVLPARAFSIAVDDPAAISISAYDAGIKGYHLALAGCVACTKPITVGPAGPPRLITVKAPAAQKVGDAGSLASAVEIARGAVGFESLIDAQRWQAEVRPTLRAELLFRPSENEWTFGSSRGYALELLGGRIYNRCTGEIVLSSPPSQGEAERPLPGHEHEDPACAPPRSAGAPKVAGAGVVTAGGAAEDVVRPMGEEPPAAAAAGDQPLPTELSKSAIAESMGQIRAQVFACYQKYQVPGTVQLSYEIAGNGTVQAIRLGGALDGTPTGACVLDAGKNARFPRFQAGSQRFSYPFFLRK